MEINILAFIVSRAPTAFLVVIYVKIESQNYKNDLFNSNET